MDKGAVIGVRLLFFERMSENGICAPTATVMHAGPFELF